MGIKIKYVTRVDDKKGAELLFKDELGKIVYLDRDEDRDEVIKYVKIGDVIPVWVLTEKARFDFCKTMIGNIGVIDLLNSISKMSLFNIRNFKHKNFNIIKFLSTIIKYDDNFKSWVSNGYSLPDNLDKIMIGLEDTTQHNNIDFATMNFIKALGYLYSFHNSDKPKFIDGLDKKDTRTIEELIDDGMTEDELLSLYKKKKSEKSNDAEKLYNLLSKSNETYLCLYGTRGYNYNLKPMKGENGFILFGTNENGFKSFKIYFGDEEFDDITDVFSLVNIWSKS